MNMTDGGDLLDRLQQRHTPHPSPFDARKNLLVQVALGALALLLGYGFVVVAVLAVA
jgi:hypothetical protein